MFIIITLYVQQLKRNHRKRKHSEELNMVMSGKDEKDISYFKRVCLQLAGQCYSDVTKLNNTIKQNLKMYHNNR